MRKRHRAENYHEIEQLIANASDTVKEQYAELRAAAVSEKTQKAFAALENIAAILSAQGFSVSASARRSKRVSTRKTKRAKRKYDSSGNVWEISDKRLLVQLRLLEAKAKGKDALPEAMEEAARTLRIVRKKNWKLAVGRHLAQTQGKRRAAFEKALLENAPENARADLEKHLQKVYAKIGK